MLKPSPAVRAVCLIVNWASDHPHLSVGYLSLPSSPPPYHTYEQRTDRKMSPIVLEPPAHSFSSSFSSIDPLRSPGSPPSAHSHSQPSSRHPAAVSSGTYSSPRSPRDRQTDHDRRELAHPHSQDDRPSPEDLSPSHPPIKCASCSITKTSQWRRDPDGNYLCNACGMSISPFPLPFRHLFPIFSLL